MGASRKLQGEIDRVLKKVQEGVDVFDSIWNKVYDTDNINQKEKFEADLKKEIKKLQRYRDQIKTWIQSSEIKDKKVSASYEQALMDARKLIEREMERFKICEKETKTKAFSKEGLGQQPKTDPREKAKSETRDWLNNVVSELENQIDSFEAEMEGLQGKKGKTRPPRLMHLETSIARHKAHIMKLELILRLLDNDELSPEQVNDVKDFLDDYMERNQDDFDEFSDVDELYSSLPLDKVESLEDLVTVGPPALAKSVPSSITAATALSTAPTQHTATTVVSTQQAAAASDQGATSPQENVTPRTPPTKIGALSMSATQTPAATGQVTPGVAANASPPVALSSATKDEDTTKFPLSKPSPAVSESGIQAIGRGVVSGQSTPNILPSPGKSIPSNGAVGAISSASDVGKRNLFGSDDRVGSPGIVQSPLSNRVMLSQAKANDGVVAADADAAALGSRVFTSPVVPGMQWRPGASFQNQSETGQIRGRAEIAPDQREKFLQRLQQVQQQGQGNILSMPPLAGGKPFSPQQPGLLLQQFNAQGPSITPQLGSLGIGVQASGANSIPTSAPSQPPLQSPVFQSSSQPTMFSTTSKDAETKNDDSQPQHPLPEDSAVDTGSNDSGLGKNLLQEDEAKSSYVMDATAAESSSPSEPPQLTVETDLSQEQPLQAASSSGNLGAIGRRSVPDFGTIGDSISPSNASGGVMHDHLYNLQMLDAAFHRLPQPRDSERTTYTPRHPAVTPPSYPQVQAPIINNPAFWDRIGGDTDMLFFTFYYQQNTYQQYLAARSLKNHSWRFHRKYNTWFQRRVEPNVVTEDFEQGTYVYFDYNIANEEHGWRQKIKHDFIFEYSSLEDELVL